MKLCTLHAQRQERVLCTQPHACQQVENGERAVVTEKEYIDARMSIEVPEPDPLAIRPVNKMKRQRGAGMRCRARALLLAQQLGKGRAA